MKAAHSAAEGAPIGDDPEPARKAAYEASIEQAYAAGLVSGQDRDALLGPRAVAPPPGGEGGVENVDAPGLGLGGGTAEAAPGLPPAARNLQSRMKPAGPQAQVGPPIPPPAMAYLRANPGTADQFDAMFGPGSAARVLGGQ